MAETVKVVKKPTKPKKSTAKKTRATQTPRDIPTHDEVAQLAYRFWAERGYQHGHAEEDWYRAQHELESA